VLPVIATQVINMAADPNADLKELSKLVHQDQSLAGHVLRMSNSTFYSRDTPIRTLKEAINLLGFTAIREMATVISIKNQVFQHKDFTHEIKIIWKHALLSGFYAKAIAGMIGKDTEIPFICGLLHTVGKPILFQLLIDLGGAVIFERSNEMIPINLVERYHSFVGQQASEKWNLPREVGACCEFFKERWDAGEHRQTVAIILLSSRLAKWCQFTDRNQKTNIERDSVLKELELTPEQLTKLFELKASMMESIKAVH
jgi:HD-like signal output (HDOD) protein